MNRPLLAVLLSVIGLLLITVVWLSLASGFIRIGFQETKSSPAQQVIQDAVSTAQYPTTSPSSTPSLSTSTVQINSAPKTTTSAKQNTNTGVTSVQSPPSLVIGSVKIDPTAGKAKVTWTTSVSARSQLILTSTGQGFDSINGVGTNHEVDLSQAKEGGIYNFHIEAHTNDGKLTDNYYGQFTGVGPSSAFFVKGSENCGTIQVVDYEGVFQAQLPVFIRVNYYRNGQPVTYSQTISTDVNGRIQDYTGCSTISSVSLSGKNLEVTVRLP
jgi:hypothetical protein